MKGKKFTILVFVLLTAMGVLTGCGKKKIDIMEDLTVSFEGYDGYGTAKLEKLVIRCWRGTILSYYQKGKEHLLFPA